MSLENLLKPFKAVDHLILKQYTKIVAHAESKEVSRYQLALASHITAAAAIITAGVSATYIELQISSPQTYPKVAVPTIGLVGIVTGAFISTDIPDTIKGIQGKYHEHSNVKAFDQLCYNAQKRGRAIRLPFVVLSSLFFNEAYHLARDISVTQAIPIAAMATFYLALASSPYIKDHDPKILDKESIFKKPYHWMTQQGKNIKDVVIPPPQPKPVPIPVYDQ